MSRPFAVFDIDGTVIRWQLYHAIADELASRGHLDSRGFDKVREARMTWKRRTSETSFLDYEEELVKLIDTSLKGLKVEYYAQACQAVLSEYRDQVYTYTRDLIKELKAKNYLLFAISASQANIVAMFADYYGFDGSGGSEYEVKNGRFTGVKSLLLKRDRKPKLLKELVAKHGAAWQDSVAVGDSESDIPMLASVQNPIAFNPSRQLFEHARQAGWKIVLERKNMAYELEPGSDGKYLLADTNA